MWGNFLNALKTGIGDLGHAIGIGGGSPAPQAPSPPQQIVQPQRPAQPTTQPFNLNQITQTLQNNAQQNQGFYPSIQDQLAQQQYPHNTPAQVQAIQTAFQNEINNNDPRYNPNVHYENPLVGTAEALPLVGQVADAAAGGYKYFEQGTPGIGQVSEDAANYKKQQDAIDNADQQAESQYKSGKISRDRYLQLLYSNTNDRNRLAQQYSDTASNYITPKEGLSDIAQTAVNIGSLGVGAAADTALGAAAKGALINAGYGAAQGGLQELGAGGTPGQIAGAAALSGIENAPLGAGLGLGGHIVSGLRFTPPERADAVTPESGPPVQVRADSSLDQPPRLQANSVTSGIDSYTGDIKADNAKALAKGVQNTDAKTGLVRSGSEYMSPDLQAATQEALDRQKFIANDPNQQTQNRVAITAKSDKGVLGQVSTTMHQRESRFNRAVVTGSKLNATEMSELDRALTGKTVDNSKVMKTAAQLHDAYDYSLAADRAGGSLTRRYNKGKYAPLYFKATPEEMDALGIPESERIVQKGQYTGFHDQSRYYKSYDEGLQKAGLERLNANAIEDARMYAQQGRGPIQNNLLYTHLKRVAPDEISNDNNDVRIGDTPLTPAANGQLPFKVSDRLNRRLEGYKSNKLSNPLAETAMKAAETPLKLSRKVAFLGAPIHYANLTEKQLALTLPSGHVITGGKTLATSLASVTHPAVYDALEAQAEKSGTRDFMRQLGVPESETRPNLLNKGTGLRGKIEKYSPFAMQYRNLGRFNNVLGWRLAERVKQLGIDPATAEGQAIGTEISKVIDRLNPEKEGINPLMQRFFTAGSIAPNWIRVNIGLTKDAIVKSLPIPVKRDGAWGTTFEGRTGFGMQNPGDIARTTVFGGRLLLGAATVIGSALLTGEMPTLQKALNEAGFNPNNPVPNFETSDQNTKQQPVVTNVPTDALGLGLSLLTNPTHFGIARETPALSAVTQAATNQDWTGNPIVDKSKPGWQLKLAEKAATNSLQPFSAQNLENPALTTGQKIASLFGLRTHRDPNDPQYKSAVAYVTGSQQVINSLAGRDKTAAQTFYARNKDANNKSFQLGPKGEQAVGQALFGSDGARNAIQQQMQKDPSHDPMWNLSPDQLKTFMRYQSEIKDSGEQVALKQANPWMSKLESDRSTYFNQLQKAGLLSPGVADPNDPAVKYPLSQQEGNLMGQASAITDPTAKTQFYADNPQLTAVEYKYGQYVNQVRQAQGAAPLPLNPPPSPDLQAALNAYAQVPKGGGSKGGNKYEALFLQAHPEVSAYFAQSTFNSLLRNAATTEASGGQADTKTMNSLYKEIASTGQYDIVKNADGSYSFGVSGSGGSGGSGGFRGKGGGSSSGVQPIVRAVEIKNKPKPNISINPKRVHINIRKPYAKPVQVKIPGAFSTSPHASPMSRAKKA